MKLSPQSAAAFSSNNLEGHFLMGNQPFEDKKVIRETAHSYTQEKLRPQILGAFCNKKISPVIFPEMGKMGIIGTPIPKEYSGLDSSYLANGLVAREIERVDSGYGISLELGVIRHMINLEMVNTYEGVHDVNALPLGRAQTDLQTFA